MGDVTVEARSVTLHGSLVGDIWMPQVTATLEVTDDLKERAARFINAEGSGLIDAVKSVVDGAGDFRSARLTADSYVCIEHWTYNATSQVGTRRTRIVDCATLPSLTGYVAPEWPEVS
jgi:hypothetical protein